MKRSFIIGWGSALPEPFVRSGTLDGRHGLRAGTTERRSGVATRPLADPRTTQVALAAQACEAAMVRAGIGADDLDLLLFAGSVGYQPIPATAPFVKAAIGAERPFPAYDIGATCLGALVALDQAGLMVASGRAARALVVAAEIASRALPWPGEPAVAGLFGDGAAAWVVGRAPGVGGAFRVGPLVMETHEEGRTLCELRSGGTRIDRTREPSAFERGATFAMEGRGLYRLSTAIVPRVMDAALAGRGWSREDVDLVVPHQASPGALTWLSRRCGFAPGVVWDEVASVGNLVAASLPAAFARAAAAGRMASGTKTLLVGTSAGVSVGAMTVEAA